MNTPMQLLHIENLILHFRTQTGSVQAVDDVNFDLDFNRAVVILGESGCGKTSLSKALLRLLPRNVEEYSGKIMLHGTDIMSLNDEEYRQNVRWMGVSLVPQAAMNALNPVLKVGDQVAEPAILHLGISQAEALGLVYKMFQHVGVPADFVGRYPFELSGGMRQRVALAMALVTSPSLIVLDEPTSALDLLTQANIMNVLKRIKHELGTSFILITHDIATSSELADEVAIMYAGQIVESGDAKDFFPAPLHPYSQMLMASVPRLRSDSDPMFITGQPPSLMNPPTGCRFAARCPFQFEKCGDAPPVFQKGKRRVKCWLHE
ncbi:MAG: ABC transporter ATP-binding protein [Anaerolineales bacterium]|nr:MAG: ABC transporter ATP-binding protein [Anaerolineales bacterium]